NKSQNIHKRFIEIHKTSQKSYTFTKIHILHIEFTKLHKHSLGGSQKITKIAIYIYIYIYTKKNQNILKEKKHSNTYNKKTHTAYNHQRKNSFIQKKFTILHKKKIH